MNTIKKVFYILILIFILNIFLSGCSVFNLSDFVLPDDVKFISCIEKLNTPKKICSYMKENFTYKPHPFHTLTPYALWKLCEGDCDDCSTFAIFVANYHNYQTYQIQIFFKGTFIVHVLAVYSENCGYTYSNIKAYCPICASNFNDIVSDFFKFPIEYELNYYKVYDYNMNLIEQN